MNRTHRLNLALHLRKWDRIRRGHESAMSPVKHPRLSQTDLLRPLAPRQSAQLCVARLQPAKLQGLARGGVHQGMQSRLGTTATRRKNHGHGKHESLTRSISALNWESSKREPGLNFSMLRNELSDVQSPPTLAHALLLAVLRFNVIYNVVRMGCIATYAAGT